MFLSSCLKLPAKYFHHINETEPFSVFVNGTVLQFCIKRTVAIMAQREVSLNLTLLLRNEQNYFFLYLSSNWFSNNKHKLIFIECQITPTAHIKKVAKYPQCPNGVNNLHRIILYHNCVCGILLRKLKKFSKYTMKTWKFITHIYDVLFSFSHRMTYAGLVKRAKSHFENCNNGPEETPVQGDCSYILTPQARPSPARPECKKFQRNNGTGCYKLMERMKKIGIYMMVRYF